MNTSKTIRKILFLAMWLVICAGMLTLFIAAMGKQKRELCKGYSIRIKAQREDNFFLDESGITKLLKTAVKGNIKGQSKTAFNLLQMEELLEDNVWIKDAQLYFDNKSVLHISVEEREPIARVFTAGGRSFYMDETGHILPLSEKAIAKVPVFTGFPDKKMVTKEDSMLLNDVSATAKYIATDSFWSSQVAQLDIVINCGPGCWEFEMVPVIGRHVVKLGNGTDIQQKLKRLFVFYQQVLANTGMDHYKTIDIRFAGQVIGGKSENPKVDSIQLRKNVEALLQQMNELSRQEVIVEGINDGAAGRDNPAVQNINRSEVSNDPKPREN